MGNSASACTAAVLETWLPPSGWGVAPSALARPGSSFVALPARLAPERSAPPCTAPVSTSEPACPIASIKACVPAGVLELCEPAGWAEVSAAAGMLTGSEVGCAAICVGSDAVALAGSELLEDPESLGDGWLFFSTFPCSALPLPAALRVCVAEAATSDDESASPNGTLLPAAAPCDARVVAAVSVVLAECAAAWVERICTPYALHDYLQTASVLGRKRRAP